MRTAEDVYQLYLATIHREYEAAGDRRIDYGEFLAAVLLPDDPPDRTLRELLEPTANRAKGRIREAARVNRVIERYRPTFFEMLADLYARALNEGWEADLIEQARSKANRVRAAQNPRNPEIHAVIKVLAKKHFDTKAKELWPLFSDDLEVNGFRPEPCRKDSLRYKLGGRRKEMSYRTFRDLVAKFRKK